MIPRSHLSLSIKGDQLYITRRLAWLMLAFAVAVPTALVVFLTMTQPGLARAQHPWYCGDRVCNEDEDANSCPQDCPPSCGDNICSPGENTQNCFHDCQCITSYCGDTVCLCGETHGSCPSDCGCAPRCGDGVCELDCGENMSNCPADCTPSPNAVNDTAITDEDVAIEIDVLANDTTPVGTLNPASVTVTMAPANGATSVNVATGAITYTPALDHFGTDQFIYQVCHTLSRCDTATVSITINGINDPPYANDDTVTTDEDVAIEINVLANDTDDGTLDPTSVTVITPPQQGLVTIDATTGAVTYTPNLDYNGADTLVYQVCDNDSTCSTATVFITITPVDDPPTANPDEIHVQINTQAAFNPVANDTDPDSILDPCAVMLITQPTNGAATLDASCRTIYTPLVGFTGTDSFNYQICDDTGLCANSTITLIVSPNPPQPTAAPQPTTFDPALSKAGPASAAVIGELIPWSITASNTGIQTTEAYTFSDPVPPTFDIRDVVVNGKATYFISGNTITFNVEPLEPGEQVHITVNTIANQQARPGQACNSLAPAQSANSTACAMLYPNTLPAAGERTRLRIVVPSIGILAALAGGSWLIKKRR